MKKEAKIYLFRDRTDYVRKITNDDIFNITGEKGSGKSFLSDRKEKDNDCIVIHLDPVFMPQGNKEHNNSKKVGNLLIKKFGNKLKPDVDFEENYYKTIVNYLKNKNKKSYIEGGNIAEMQNVSNIIGTVIVKRTSVLKCFVRTVKRDYHNDYFMQQEIKLHGKMGKLTRLYKVIKRRKKILKSYHSIEKFIQRLEEYEKSISKKKYY